MNDEELMRDLASRFYKKGWLQKIEMNQQQSKLGMMIEWTEAGRKLIMSLHALLDELGYMAGSRRGGEINILFELITDKECSALPMDAYLRPFLQSAVNTRMDQSGWITTEERGKQVILVGWTEKGSARKRQFQELLQELNCTETFVQEFEGIFTFTRACASSIRGQQNPPEHKRY